MLLSAHIIIATDNIGDVCLEWVMSSQKQHQNIKIETL